METKEYYESPQVTVIEVEVEKGFAQSLGTGEEIEDPGAEAPGFGWG